MDHKLWYPGEIMRCTTCNGTGNIIKIEVPESKPVKPHKACDVFEPTPFKRVQVVCDKCAGTGNGNLFPHQVDMIKQMVHQPAVQMGKTAATKQFDKIDIDYSAFELAMFNWNLVRGTNPCGEIPLSKAAVCMLPAYKRFKGKWPPRSIR